MDRRIVGTMVIGAWLIVGCGSSGVGTGVDAGPDAMADAALDGQSDGKVDGGVPAVITSAPSLTVVEGETWTYDATASGDAPITWTLTTPDSGTPAVGVAITTSPPEGAAVNLGWDTTGVTPGAYTIALQANNDAGDPDVQQFEVTVEPRPPVPDIDLVTTPPPATVFVDTPYAYDVDLTAASDSTGIVWSIEATVPDPLAITVDSDTGEVAFTPSSAEGARTYSYTVRATNAVGDFDEETVSVDAEIPPASPILTVSPDTMFELDTGESFAGAAATATGNPTPTLSISGTLPDFVEFDALTGQLSASSTKPAPDLGDLGVHTFDIVATNPLGNDSETITIEVLAAPPAVDAIVPAAGRRQSEVPIVVKGSGFVAAATPEIVLELGGYSETLTTTFVDDETLTATVPIDLARPSGVFDVVVDQGNVSRLNKRFTVTEGDGATLSGLITFSLTLPASNSPYRVTGDLRIENGAVLTLEPGTVLMFNDNVDRRIDVGVASGGAIVADGGEPGVGDQVVFTRYQAAGGPAPTGHYRGLRFGANVIQSSQNMRNVVVEFAGRRGTATNQGAVEVLASSAPSITDSLIRESLNYGLDMDGGAGSDAVNWFDGNTIVNSGQAPISVAVNDLTTLGTDLTLSDNGSEHVEVRGGTVLRASNTWPTYDVPYYVTSDVTIRGGASVTIDPGANLRFANGRGLFVSSATEPGTLIAVGTAAEPIVMEPDSGVAGEWDGIRFDDNPGAGTVLRYVNIEGFGGKAGPNINGGISVDNDDTGLFPVIVENCVIRSTAADTRGVYMQSTAKLASFENNVIDVTALSVNAYPAGMGSALAASNAYQAPLQVIASTLSTEDVAWAKPTDNGGATQPIMTTGSVTVRGVDLSLAPGIVMQMALNAQIATDTFGTLTAVGTAAEPIVFEPAPGVAYWNRLYLRTDSASGPSVLDHVSITGAGGDPALTENSARAAILVASQTIDGTPEPATPSITNTLIANSNGFGIAFGDRTYPTAFSDNTISGSRFSSVRIYGNFVGELGNNNTLTGNNTSGDVDHDGIWVHGDRIDVSATWTDHGVPYVSFNGSLDVRQSAPADPVPTLTLAEGVELLFGPSRRLIVGSSNDGILNVAGTVANPVLLSSVDTTTPTFWRGIEFYAGSDGSIVDNATVSYGGVTNNEGNLIFRSGSDMITIGAVQMTHAEDYAAVIQAGAGVPIFTGVPADRGYVSNGQESVPGVGDPAFDCVRDSTMGNICTQL